MPLHRCQIDSPLSSPVVLARIAALIRESPGFWQCVKESFGGRKARSPPFIGEIDGSSCRMRRDIRYRNSFLPCVRGAVVATPTGTRVILSMNLHPFVAVFMLVWLGAVGAGTLAALFASGGDSQTAFFPAGMFVFGLVLTAGGFLSRGVQGLVTYWSEALSMKMPRLK